MGDLAGAPAVHPELGAYAHVVRCGALLFVSGQVPVTPTGDSLPAEDVEGQARQVFENLQAVLAREGCSLADVASLTTYLCDVADAAVVGAVRGTFLGDHRPSSTVVGVSQLLLPQWRIEVQAIATLTERAHDG